MADSQGPVIELVAWTGPWSEDDRDANLKADVALYAVLDPLVTLRGPSAGTAIPVGAPAVRAIESAESADTDEARLAATRSVVAAGCGDDGRLLANHSQ